MTMAMWTWRWWWWWRLTLTKCSPRARRLQLYTAFHPHNNSARRFCLFSSLLHRWIGWSSERLNALLKVTQLVRIRGEVWRLRITAHDHYTVALIRGSQTCLLLVEERTHYLSAQTPYALPLPTLYLWKYVSLTWTAGDTPYIPNRIT